MNKVENSRIMIKFSVALLVLTASVTASLVVAVYVALPLLRDAGVILEATDWTSILKGLMMIIVIIVALAYLNIVPGLADPQNAFPET